LSSRPSLSSSPRAPVFFFTSGADPHWQSTDVTQQDAAAPRIPKRMPSLLDCDEIQAVFSQPVLEYANVSSPAMPKRMESLTDYGDSISAAPSSLLPRGRGLSSRPSLSSSPRAPVFFFTSGADPHMQAADITHDAAAPRIPKRIPSLLDCVEIQALFSQPVLKYANLSSPTMPTKRTESLTDYDDIFQLHSPRSFLEDEVCPRVPLNPAHQFSSYLAVISLHVCLVEGEAS
jgi:hypothetical protein